MLKLMKYETTINAFAPHGSGDGCLERLIKSSNTNIK